MQRQDGAGLLYDGSDKSSRPAYTSRRYCSCASYRSYTQLDRNLISTPRLLLRPLPITKKCLTPSTLTTSHLLLIPIQSLHVTNSSPSMPQRITSHIKPWLSPEGVPPSFPRPSQYHWPPLYHHLLPSPAFSPCHAHPRTRHFHSFSTSVIGCSRGRPANEAQQHCISAISGRCIM